MRRIVLVVPGLVGGPDSESVLRHRLPAFERMAEIGALCKVSPIPLLEAPEALWLGLPPSEGQLRQGPLTVAALGADPPARSTHFHVSPLALVDGRVMALGASLTETEARQVVKTAKRLNTSSLTFVAGDAEDHGLVWESLVDMVTRGPTEAVGKPISTVMPEGDGDRVLRRFIDDSINLLSEQAFNLLREEEGLASVNLLWPWGHGVRLPVPNLALRRGEVVQVESASLRLAGLSRLVGYRHGDRSDLGRGLNLKLAVLSERALLAQACIQVIDVPGALRAAGQTEELDWFVHELNRDLIQPLMDSLPTTPTRLTLIAPGLEAGLACTAESGRPGSGSAPFDERALDDRSLSTNDARTLIERGLAGPEG